MNLDTPRKTRSDCVLKNLSGEQQEAIATYGQTHSVTDTRAWIIEQYKITPGRTAVGEYLAWVRMTEQRHENRGAIHGLVTPIESDAPLLSSEDLQNASRRHFAETVVKDSNVSAFNQSERIALRREELQLQREHLALDREKFHRTYVESIVSTCNDPKVRAASQKDGVSYAQKVREVTQIMFGSNESKN